MELRNDFKVTKKFLITKFDCTILRLRLNSSREIITDKSKYLCTVELGDNKELFGHPKIVP